MAFKISELKFPQWPVNQNFIFDMTASWLDKTFFGSEYSPTPEKTLIVALCTNIVGLHRVYAGRKLSAIVGWFFLFLSLFAREYVFMLLFWLAIDMFRICLCNYGRVKSKQGVNLHILKWLFSYKAGRSRIAISAGVSVLALALIIAFAPRTESKPSNLTVSRSDLYVSQTDAAYRDLQELEAEIESKSSLMEEMNLYEQNREKNQAQIESLQKEIADLTADKQSLESELQKLKSQIDTQTKLLEKMQKQTDELIKAQQSTTTKATTTQKSTTTTAKKATTTTKKPTTKKSTTTTKKTTTTTKKPTTTTKKTTTTTKAVTSGEYKLDLTNAEIGSSIDTGDLKIAHGKLLSVIYGGDEVVVIKAKITPNLTKKMTIEQNYGSVCRLIRDNGFDQCKEIQYWAVADMTDGTESKVISFTSSSYVINMVYNKRFVDNKLGDYVDDLWIHPSLR